MGFSVSGSTAIILLGVFIGFGLLYSAADTSFDRVSASHEDRADRFTDTQNTMIEIANVSHNTTTEIITVEVTNTGSTSLSIDGTTLLLDGVYRPVNESHIDDNNQTDVWLSGEQLSLEVTEMPDSPNRTVVITENGITAVVEEAE